MDDKNFVFFDNGADTIKAASLTSSLTRGYDFFTVPTAGIEPISH